MLNIPHRKKQIYADMLSILSRHTTPLALWQLSGRAGQALDRVGGHHGTPNSIDTSKSEAFVDGHPATWFGGSGSGDYIQLPHTSLNAVFNPLALTFGFWFRPPNAGFWTSGLSPFFFEIGVNSSNRIFFSRTANNNIDASYRAGGVVDNAVVGGLDFTGWGLFVATAVKAVPNKLVCYVNDKTPVESATLGVWAGSLTAAFCKISEPTATFEAHGWMENAFLCDGVVTPGDVQDLWALRQGFAA